MVLTCAYPGCRNLFKSVRLRASTQTGKLTFHRFPTFEPDRLHLWLLALQMDINTPMRLLKVWRVCSEHFSPDDFKAISGNQVLLKSSAVPMFVSQRTEVCKTDRSRTAGLEANNGVSSRVILLPRIRHHATELGSQTCESENNRKL